MELLHTYFDWSLNQRLSRDGTRKRKKVTKSSSLGTHWKVFRLVFERATSEKIDPKLNRTMHKVGTLIRSIYIAYIDLGRFFEHSQKNTV